MNGGEETYSHVLALCNPKYKLFIKDNEKSKSLSDSEKIRVNTEFNYKFTRFKITEMESVKKNTKDEDTHKLIEARGNILDSKIVRSMKTNNKMDEQELIADVIRQIRLWRAQPSDIKNRIESLIDREYMKRDESNPKYYIYLP